MTEQQAGDILQMLAAIKQNQDAFQHGFDWLYKVVCGLLGWTIAHALRRS